MAPKKPDDKKAEAENKGGKPRRWALFALVLLIALGLLVQRCWQDPPPPPVWPTDTLKTSGLPPKPDTIAIETTAQPLPTEIKPRPTLPPKPIAKTPAPDTATPAPQKQDTALPYVYADPWGGRHFDSVTVRVICRESCLVLYSLTDTLQFKSYESPLTFRRNTTLWIRGLQNDGTQMEPVKIEYVITRDPGNCPVDMVPFQTSGQEICMDKYEWPNHEDALPQAFVSWKNAVDSCASVSKRLCTLDEWQNVCAGPENARYPYAARYDARYCPAKESGPAHAGHFPACRSYYGTYDMTGNLWEWTSTPYPEREGFYRVAGGNWEAGNEATCGLSRYSFYPQNRFNMVGFRCCDEAKPDPRAMPIKPQSGP